MKSMIADSAWIVNLGYNPCKNSAIIGDNIEQQVRGFSPHLVFNRCHEFFRQILH
jgi:hypothetical protein